MYIGLKKHQDVLLLLYLFSLSQNLQSFLSTSLTESGSVKVFVPQGGTFRFLMLFKTLPSRLDFFFAFFDKIVSFRISDIIESRMEPKDSRKSTSSTLAEL